MKKIILSIFGLIVISILAGILVIAINPKEQKIKNISKTELISVNEYNGIKYDSDDNIIWQKFSYPKHNFSVFFPEKPSYMEREMFMPGYKNISPIKEYEWAVTDNNKTYFVMYVVNIRQHAIFKSSKETKIILKSMLDGQVLSNNNYKLINYNYFKFKKKDAIEYIIDIGDIIDNKSNMYVKGKMFIIGDKLYQLSIMYENPLKKDSNWNKFINSFNLK